MVWKINKKEIPYLSIGAKFVSSGGGGDTFTLQHLLQSVMSESQEIEIYPFSELSDHQHILPVFTMGSSLLCNEKMSTGEEGLLTLRAYEKMSGKTADALIPFDIGGSNALIPFIVAAQKNLPMVDGDGIARAIPEIHMSSFHLQGIKAAPFVMCNQHRDLSYFDQEDSIVLSQMARKQVQAMGGIVYVAGYGMSGRECRTAIIPNTIQVIHDIGRIFTHLHDLPTAIHQMNAIFANSVYGKPLTLIQGKIHGLKRWFKDEAIEGKFEVLGTEQWDGQAVEILFANEYLTVKKGRRYLCLTPDIILVLDEETASPCLVDDLQEGMPVTVFGIPAPNMLRTSDMLELIGPRVYDVKADFMPIEFLAELGEHDEAWN